MLWVLKFSKKYFMRQDSMYIRLENCLLKNQNDHKYLTKMDSGLQNPEET